MKKAGYSLSQWLGVFLAAILLLPGMGWAAENQQPVAVAANLITKEDKPKPVTLKGVDPEKQKLTFSIVSPPAHGKLALKRGAMVYTPDPDYFSPEGSPDSFTFKANDGQLDSSPATVSITVQASNDKPLAQSSEVLAVRSTAREIALSGSDVDSDTLSYKPDKKSKKGGTVVLKGGNVVTYTPKTGFVGKDSFNFTVRDGKSPGKPGKITVVVRAENTAPLANAGEDFAAAEKAVLLLDGSASSDEDGNIVSYAWEQVGGTPAVLQDATTATPTVVLPDVTADEILTFKLVVRDNNGAGGEDTVVVTVNAAPTLTAKLNDTGITQCGNASANAACPQAGFPGQDAETGRDATQATNNDADGHRGFNFTKLDSAGVALADQSAAYASTPWACVKDNVTGLIWEVKTDDSGLHDKDWTYTWYNTDNAKNGGGAGTPNGGSCGSPATSQCDTQGYVQAVNTAGWCGASSGWRMPSVTELRSIADLSRSDPSIDTAYFPNTNSWWYWSGTPYAGYASYAWYVSFYSGVDGWYDRDSGSAVRLVRSGQ
ncbi:DUF1566 domain-containing protein [Thiothrix subterranea]|uniref:Lcl C-terminal domain-containing protein n=1 Tax=Thiothrix subterranea TaxID=2735563 RepID=UPI00192AEE66|nr:DUF1566 domain-containing protein [Thiothrix subterranea]QQZ28570.1 DUF1566 domain-containing protein [Thiothrix subterranea]